jgi:hypothetical protein
MNILGTQMGKVTIIFAIVLVVLVVTLVVLAVKDIIPAKKWLGLDAKAKEPVTKPPEPAAAAQPVDCILGSWGAWGSCDPTTLSQSQTRAIVTAAANEGMPCQGTQQSQMCLPGGTVPFVIGPFNMASWAQFGVTTKFPDTTAQMIWKTKDAGSVQDDLAPWTAMFNYTNTGAPMQVTATHWVDDQLTATVLDPKGGAIVKFTNSYSNVVATALTIPLGTVTFKVNLRNTGGPSGFLLSVTNDSNKQVLFNTGMSGWSFATGTL